MQCAHDRSQRWQSAWAVTLDRVERNGRRAWRSGRGRRRARREAAEKVAVGSFSVLFYQDPSDVVARRGQSIGIPRARYVSASKI